MNEYEISGSKETVCGTVSQLFNTDVETARIIILGALYDQAESESLNSSDQMVRNFISSDSGENEVATFVHKDIPFTIRFSGLVNDLLVATIQDLIGAFFTSMIINEEARLLFLGNIACSVISVMREHTAFLSEEERHHPVFIALIHCAAKKKSEEKLHTIYDAVIDKNEIIEYINNKWDNCSNTDIQDILDRFEGKKILILEDDRIQLVF
jgi:hypothetical protein